MLRGEAGGSGWRAGEHQTHTLLKSFCQKGSHCLYDPYCLNDMSSTYKASIVWNTDNNEHQESKLGFSHEILKPVSLYTELSENVTFLKYEVFL